MKIIGINNLIIDPELRDLLPKLNKDEYEQLEKNILEKGLEEAIVLWQKNLNEIYLIDGHNRYSICKKHNIDIYNWRLIDNCHSKDDVVKWMLDNQLGRRNLTPVQRYAVVQKFKPYLEEQAKENKSLNGGDKKSDLTNLPTPIIEKINTRKELAKKANISEGTYSKIDKVMQSNNEEVKEKLSNNKISVNKAYNVIKPKAEENNKTTDNCDTKIAEIERKERQLSEEKQKLYIIRQKLYNETPDDDLHCVVEETINDFGFNTINILFYLVKRENKKLAIKFEDYQLENINFINKTLNIKGKEFSEKEKSILYSKIYETQKTFVEKQKIKKEKEELERVERLKKISESFNNININNQNIINEFNAPTKALLNNSFVKDIINSGYKVLAKKYHPDLTNDDGSEMQALNEAKNILDQFIA